MNDLKKKLEKASNYDNLALHTKGFMYDSLIFRFKEYQSKAFYLDVQDYKYERNCSEIEARNRIKDRYNRDLMRFVQILDEAIGEHD
jgi:hypothetical protein